MWTHEIEKQSCSLINFTSSNTSNAEMFGGRLSVFQFFSLSVLSSPFIFQKWFHFIVSFFSYFLPLKNYLFSKMNCLTWRNWEKGKFAQVINRATLSGTKSVSFTQLIKWKRLAIFSDWSFNDVFFKICFIFDCAGFSLPCMGLLWFWRAGAPLRLQWAGFSLRRLLLFLSIGSRGFRLQQLQLVGSAVAVPGL